MLKQENCSSALHVYEFYTTFLWSLLLCKVGARLLWRESGWDRTELRFESDTRCSIDLAISGIEHHIDLGTRHCNFKDIA